MKCPHHIKAKADQDIIKEKKKMQKYISLGFYASGWNVVIYNFKDNSHK